MIPDINLSWPIFINAAVAQIGKPNTPGKIPVHIGTYMYICMLSQMYRKYLIANMYKNVGEDM